MNSNFFKNFKFRIFETSEEIKKMFLFSGNFESCTMLEKTKVLYHANQLIRTINKIIFLLSKSSLDDQDKELLIELGQRHYHYGLKLEYFLVKNI